MIGGNDFCSDICYQTNATQWLNDNQEANLIKTLRYMRNNMPRYATTHGSIQYKTTRVVLVLRLYSNLYFFDNWQ